MKTTTKPGSDACELAHGRLPAHPDLDSLADLLTAYRSAAIGPAPRPSAALSARVDLTATPLAMQGSNVASGVPAGGASGRAVRGLFGLGVTVAIVLGAAGAAAAVGMGTAGLLLSGAQDVFDQVVSDNEPLGVVGVETTDQGEAPGVPAVIMPTPEPSGDAPASSGSSDDEGEDAESRHESGTGNSGHNNGIGSSGEDNGFGNSGKHNETSSDDDSDDSDSDDSDVSDDIDSDESDDSDMSTGESHVKNGGSGENNGGGNSSKDDD